MGKKKGKQSGSYASKSMRASHQSELSSRAFQEVLPNRRPLRWNHSSTSSKNTASSSTRSNIHFGMGSSERRKINVTQLRGILAERKMEDRLLDRDLRRRRYDRVAAAAAGGEGRWGNNGQPQWGRSIHSGDMPGGAVQLVNHVERHEPGWLLFYNHNEEEQVKDDNYQDGKNIPSLQYLAVQALGPYLSEYVEACGPDAIHAAVGTLSPLLLAELSASVAGVTDEILGVLGKHSHVECLSLHAPIETSEDDNGGSGGCIESVTDEGILSLVPRLISQRNADSVDGFNHNDIDDQDGGLNNHASVPSSSFIMDDDDNDDNAPESWEDVDIDLDITLEGCNQLTRLELCNIPSSVTFNAIYELLKSCPCITHLSISNSFDDEVGSNLLSHPEYGLGAGGLLSNLQVLDVSHCLWMTDILLVKFIRENVVRSFGGGDGCKGLGRNFKSSLRMISVAGCTGVTQQKCDFLNQQLGGCPLISTEVQQKKGKKSEKKTNECSF